MTDAEGDRLPGWVSHWVPPNRRPGALFFLLAAVLAFGWVPVLAGGWPFGADGARWWGATVMSLVALWILSAAAWM
jgi:hypothetical protein